MVILLRYLLSVESTFCMWHGSLITVERELHRSPVQHEFLLK